MMTDLFMTFWLTPIFSNRLPRKRSANSCSTSSTRCRAGLMRPTVPSMTWMLLRRSCPLRTPTCSASWRRPSPRCHSSPRSRCRLPLSLRTQRGSPTRKLGLVSETIEMNGNGLTWKIGCKLKMFHSTGTRYPSWQIP